MTDFNDISSCSKLSDQLRALQSTQGLTAADIAAVTVVIATTEPVRQFAFTVKPADTGWLAFLSNLNTMVGNKITNLKSQLASLAITNVP